MDNNFINEEQLLQTNDEKNQEYSNEGINKTISYLISIIIHLLLLMFFSLFSGKGFSPRATAGPNLYPVKFYELKGNEEELKNVQDKTLETTKEEKVKVSIEKVKQQKETVSIKEVKETKKSKTEATTRTSSMRKEEVEDKGVKLQKSQPSKGKEYEGEGKGGYPGDTLFPTVKNAIKPIYPKSAQNREEEGIVHLKAFILSDGTAKEVIIEKSSGSDILDEAAKTKIRSWEFAPKITNGNPSDAWIFITCIFTLENLDVECKY